ncbi:DUF1861 family protein [Enterococcus canintestini]|uniref:DUF1861 family protein n=1 Tax=Enterococcus canintestini TaxID=317010 RepID=UPI00288E2070|nr:DUF1861 family protein [Enterococcus canintestini]MDT2739990.1 DUF1861 family protein [Enterococcus canintestini]
MIYAEELLKKYREEQLYSKATVLTFKDVADKDVYNITAPFLLEGQVVLAGRVESRDDEHSEIVLFTEAEENTWVPIKESVRLSLQDPFFTEIDGDIILGGVEVNFLSSGQAKWRTVFYRLETSQDAVQIFAGPWGMKDLRLKQLNDGKILVLTRPQGTKGGRGKIGAVIIDDLASLSVALIEDAPLLANQFTDSQWGGANEIHQTKTSIWVLGHIANFDEENNRHYYAMAFELDLANFAMKNAKIIAERKDFAAGPAKRPDLVDVVFSGGIVMKDQKAVIYAGISDAGAQKLEIENPFR